MMMEILKLMVMIIIQLIIRMNKLKMNKNNKNLIKIMDKLKKIKINHKNLNYILIMI